MGCAAFTPSLVGLAKELEGQPFHLVASYNQGGDDQKAIHEIFQNGLPLTVSNVSVTRSSRHPKVQGITYVPYYMVFDQHGDLAYHHQGGPYHGGDQNAVLGRVRQMLESVAPVYVGKQSYSSHKKLAKKIASGKQLAGSLKKLAKALEVSPEDKELLRLAKWVERHAKRTQQRFERTATTNAKRAIQSLARTAKAYAGTPWGAELVAHSKRIEQKDTRKSIEGASKMLETALRAWGQLAPQRGNGGQVRNPLDPSFREANAAHIEKVSALFESVKENHGQLPAGRAAANALAMLKR